MVFCRANRKGRGRRSPELLQRNNVFIMAECLYRCSSSVAVNHPLFRIDRSTKKGNDRFTHDPNRDLHPPLLAQYYKSARLYDQPAVIKSGNSSRENMSATGCFDFARQNYRRRRVSFRKKEKMENVHKSSWI